MEPTDAARGRALVERWCVLAEQRLDYLTELFESGRWRRFFGEVAFLENIQEAKAAVETWRDLLHHEATLDDQPVDLSWLGHNKTLQPRPIFYLSDEAAAEPEWALPGSSPAVAPAEPTPRLKVVASAEPVLETAASPAIVPDQVPAWQHALDSVLLEQRYPLLRKAG